MKKIFILSILCAVFSQANQHNTPKSGNQIYKNCVSCHGLKGDNPALGKSAPINLMDEIQISKALHGYIDETYGGELKTIMKIEAQKLTKEEIEAVSKYIPTLAK